MDANLMNAAEGSQRKPRRHATRVAEDIAIVVAIKIVRPYRAERREKEAKWQEVARLANEALDVKDITAEMCRRRFKALIEQVARASTLPQAGSQPLDPKLFTLVMEMFVDVKNHFDEMETARVDQMQEFRRKVLLAAPPCTSSASSDSDPTRASPPPPLPPPTDPAAAITQATEEEPGSPHRSQKSTKRKTPRYATEDQVAKTRKLAALRVRPCNKRVKTLADELEALAAAFEIAKQEQREKDAAWRTQLETSQKEHDAQIHQLSRENGELRTQLVATQKKQTQQDEQIELHALESQAQQEEVAALQQALASEHEERVRLEQDVSRMKVDAAASREQTLRETYEMTMLQMNTVDEMESVLRQQRQLMREYKRLFSSTKRLRDDQATGAAVDAALLQAVLSQLPHHAARGHVLKSWQRTAESVLSDTGESLSEDACKRRYVELLATARHWPVDRWPADLKELLTAALLEDKQWKIETREDDPNSVARHTRLAVSGVKQEDVKVEVKVMKGTKATKDQWKKSYEDLEAKLERVVSRLDTMERKWLEHKNEYHEKAEKEVEELKHTVDTSQQKLVAVQEKVTALEGSLLPITEAHEKLQQEATTLRSELEESRRENQQVRQDMASLRAEMLPTVRSNAWTMEQVHTDIKKLQAAQRIHEEAFVAGRKADEGRRASQYREISDSVRRELQRRDELLLSMQSVLESYERQRDLKERHRKSVLALEERSREDHQARVEHRLTQLEQKLKTLLQEVGANQAAQAHQEKQLQLTGQLELLDRNVQELKTALDIEINERRSENTKLLLTIRRILTTNADSETESE